MLEPHLVEVKVERLLEGFRRVLSYTHETIVKEIVCFWVLADPVNFKGNRVGEHNPTAAIKTPEECLES